MEAVEANEMFTLQFPVEAEHPDYTAQVDATALWGAIVESATKTAEPGLLMWDNITKKAIIRCWLKANILSENQ